MEPPSDRTPEAVARENVLLQGINRILAGALSARSAAVLGALCLEVMEDTTGAAFSFLGEINGRRGTLHNLAVSERGWASLSRANPAFPADEMPTELQLQGLYGRVLTDGSCILSNKPARADRIGSSFGDLPLRSFLGIPLRDDGATIGMIGVGNRTGGFRPEDLATAEALAAAIAQALGSKRAEEAGRKGKKALRDNERRLGFLMTLSDALRPLGNPLEIEAVATRMLGEHLGADRVFYAELQAVNGEPWCVTERDFASPGTASAVGRTPFSAWDSVADELRVGRTVAVGNLATDPRLPQDFMREYRAGGLSALVAVPLVRNGDLKAILGIHQNRPRVWTRQDLSLAEETAERIWESVWRPRVEAALRESQERLAVVFQALPVGVAVVDANGAALTANDEMRRFLPKGLIPTHDPNGATRWKTVDDDGELLAPGDYPTARALRGESVVPGLEMLYTQDDGHDIWTQVAAVPMQDPNGHVVGAFSVVMDIDQLKQAQAHQAVLLAELQHRVRNILAMIRSLVGRSSPGKTDLEDYVAHLQGRIDALARTQALLTLGPGEDADLETIVHEEMRAQAAAQTKFTVQGPSLRLAAKATELLTLALHELATNSVKYGALRYDEGHIAMRWDRERRNARDWLVFTWRETGVQRPTAQPRPGFGMELITRRIPYELDGESELVFEDGCVNALIQFPLQNGSSILQTGAGNMKDPT
jgi:two-component sensor histidine kinase/GAF domain-containing protein